VYNSALKKLSELRDDYAKWRAREPSRWPDSAGVDFMKNESVNLCFWWLGVPYLPKEKQRKLVEQLKNGKRIIPPKREVPFVRPEPSHSDDQPAPGITRERVHGQQTPE
jgi:hypothetical protein